MLAQTFMQIYFLRQLEEALPPIKVATDDTGSSSSLTNFSRIFISHNPPQDGFTICRASYRLGVRFRTVYSWCVCTASHHLSTAMDQSAHVANFHDWKCHWSVSGRTGESGLNENRHRLTRFGTGSHSRLPTPLAISDIQPGPLGVTVYSHMMRMYSAVPSLEQAWPSLEHVPARSLCRVSPAYRIACLSWLALSLEVFSTRLSLRNRLLVRRAKI